jgi:secondary thiamine-phosphate synthase enzyme
LIALFPTLRKKLQSGSRLRPDFILHALMDLVVNSYFPVVEMVEDEVARSGVSSGQVTVFVPATACAIVVNERESGLMDDISRTLRRLESHSPPAAQTVIGSASVVLPAVDGRLRLGTWQRVLLIDLEGAVDRPVVVQIVGD